MPRWRWTETRCCANHAALQPPGCDDTRSPVTLAHVRRRHAKLARQPRFENVCKKYDVHGCCRMSEAIREENNRSKPSLLERDVLLWGCCRRCYGTQGLERSVSGLVRAPINRGFRGQARCWL